MDLFPIALAFLAGLLPIVLLLPAAGEPHRAPRLIFGLLPSSPALLLLVASLAFPLGASLIGLANFLLLAMDVDMPWAAYAAVAGLSGLLWFFRIRPPAKEASTDTSPSDHVASASFPLNWALAVMAAVSLIAVLAAMSEILAKSPHGAWDSWAIWSLRGKFFAGGAAFWRNAVDPGFHLSHPEYPVMFSSYLGWGWRLAGIENSAVPQAVAYAYLLSLAGIVGAGIGVLRRASLGLMAIPVLLSPIVMVTVPASLYADLPLGVLSAATVVLLLLGIASRWGARPYALAGVFASLCAWTKEEGLLHLAVFSVVALLFAWLSRAGRPRWWLRAAIFLSCAAPAGLLYAWFRFAIAPGGTRFAGAPGSDAAAGGLAARALDISRYGEIAGQVWHTLATLGNFLSHPLLLLALTLVLLGIHRQRLKNPVFLAAAATLALLWAGYLASFLLMGGRPGPNLAASLHRLWLHTWPLFVMAVFLLVQAPEDLATPVAARLSRSERKQAKPARGRPRKGDA